MFRLEVTTRPSARSNIRYVRISIFDMHPVCKQVNYDIEVPDTMIRADGRINRRIINEQLPLIVAHFFDTYCYCVRSRVPGVNLHRFKDLAPKYHYSAFYQDILDDPQP